MVSPDVCPFQIDEKPITEAPVTSPTIEIPSGSHEETPYCEEAFPTTSGIADPKDDSCSKSMDPPIGDLTQDFFVDPNMPGKSQVTPPLFGQFVQQAEIVTSNPLISPTSLHATGTTYASIDETAANRAIAIEITLTETTLPNFSITRQEVLILSSVWGRFRKLSFRWKKSIFINQCRLLW